MDKNDINSNSFDLIKEIFTALDFAAYKHRLQKRKVLCQYPILITLLR